MIPPVDGTNHVQMLLYLLSLLQPLAAGTGQKNSKASDFFMQTMQDAHMPPTDRAFEHSVQLLPTLRVYQKILERVAPLQLRSHEKPGLPPSSSTSLFQKERPISFTEEPNDSTPENSKPLDEPIHLETEFLPPSPIQPEESDPLPPSTFQLARRLIEQIQTAMGDLEATEIPILNPDHDISEKTEPFGQIAIRLQPAITQLIEGLESFTKPTLTRPSIYTAAPSSLPHEQAVKRAEPFQKTAVTNLMPRQNQTGERGVEAISTPGSPSATPPHSSQIATPRITVSSYNTPQEASFSFAFSTIGTALRIRTRQEASESPAEGKFLTAMPYSSTPIALSSYISFKRKKEKKKQREEGEPEDSGQLDDYSEKA